MSDYRDFLVGEKQAAERELEAQAERRAETVGVLGFDHPLSVIEREYEAVLADKARTKADHLYGFDQGVASVVVSGVDPELLASLDDALRDVRINLSEAETAAGNARYEIDQINTSDAEDSITGVESLIEQARECMALASEAFNQLNDASNAE